MQRMTKAMRRSRDERGAVGVMLALLMIPLIGFAAVAVDVAAMAAERQQLQVGADAGALAIAQDCARNNCSPDGLAPADTAQALAVANSNDGEAVATVIDAGSLSPSSGQVTVQNTGVSEHWFAPVLGFDESGIVTRATAAWSSPTGGTAVLPMAFSWCEFLAQTGGGLPSGTLERTIFFTKSSGTTCTGPSNNVVPGGFGWLAVNSGTCNTTSTMGAVLWTSTGAAVPSGCTTADFAAVQNRTVLLPIFDQTGDSGSNSWYRLYGYAAFQVTGYQLGGQYKWNDPCSGDDRCIRGYFTQFVDLSSAFQYGTGAPQLGTAVVKLTG